MLERHANSSPLILMGILGLEMQIYMLTQCYKIGFFGNFQQTATTSKIKQNTSGWSTFFCVSVTFQTK